LFLSEILPKTLGVRYAAQLGPYIAWPLQAMIWLVWPIVKIGRLLVWLLGRGRQPAIPTADEIVVMSRLAAKGGQLRAQEVRWVENALRLDEIRVYDLMTPRTVVYTLPADLPLTAVQERSEHWVHSRLPLTDDRDPDQIVGMVHRRDVFDALVRGHRQLTLRSLMRELDFVPDTMRGHQLLDKLITEKKHMAAVIDEYGSFVGVVTLEDVLECLLGSEIVDEHDRHTDMQQWARSRAQQRQEAAARHAGKPQPT
jgi:CBS domain containing-hemolysin-like protein